MLSVKLEVHNVSQCRQRTEPRHRQHAQKYGELRPCSFRVMPLCRQADRQRSTNILITVLGKVTNEGLQIWMNTFNPAWYQRQDWRVRWRWRWRDKKSTGLGEWWYSEAACSCSNSISSSPSDCSISEWDCRRSRMETWLVDARRKLMRSSLLRNLANCTEPARLTTGRYMARLQLHRVYTVTPIFSYLVARSFMYT